MKLIAFTMLVMFLAGVCPNALGKLTPEQVRNLPPPATQPINFTKDVKPILEASCVKCHGHGRAKGGFRLDTRETLLQGGDSGPAVVAGNSAESHLIELVSGLDPDNVMPKKGSRLKPEQISLLRAWIDQGLSWDASVSLGKVPSRNLTPRHPDLPRAHQGLLNPIDVLLQSYFATNKTKQPKPVDDRIYARRVYLDVIGVLPTPKELAVFESDTKPDKRERLVQQLLADNRRYAEHWLTFWNDLLRNDYRGTGYIDGGRKQISTWLFSALAQNMPYDKFVASLINPTEDNEGFVKGIVWRGVVNASQAPEMQTAQNISQVFMGVNLKCASCHDSFINDWTLADAYGMASIYATNALAMFECDKPTGKTAKVKFLYSELGDIAGDLPKGERQKQLAELLTQRSNGRLSRTIVNRFWAKFMGRGLVEPVDDMEQPAWHGDVLDCLAEDLVDHGYDLKRTIYLILTSRAYQMPAVSLEEQRRTDFVFTGPAVRRMTAEQFRDALGSLTDVRFENPAAQFDFSSALPKDTPLLKPGIANWIWSDAMAAHKARPQTIYLRKPFTLAEAPDEAFVAAACDNSYTLYVNGERTLSGKDYKQPNFADIRSRLHKGENVLAVSAENYLPENKPASSDADVNESDANPAGLLLYVRMRRADQVLDFGTDKSWIWAATKQDGWEKPEFAAEHWKAVAELGDVGMEPWTLGKKLAQTMSMALVHGEVRASLVPADALTTALGRPNREQVNTTRASAATTLQALELTNGDTLTKLLRRGAEKVLAGKPASSQALVKELYRKALGREPTRAEMQLAEKFLGGEIKNEGVEDLLWAMVMLPEFQLIY